MQNANPLSPTPISELFYLKKKNKFELWFENNESDKSLVDSEEEFEEEEEEDDLEYFDTFPTREELKVRGLKVFVGNFTYECDFVVLEDISSVIDHYLGRIVLGQPFVKESGLVYDKDEGTIMFEKDNERITYKMPHKMETFKNIEDLNTDNIPPFVITSDDDEENDEGFVNRHRRTHYSDCLNLGPEYKHDESVTKVIQCLIKMKRSVSDEGVT
ncbi:hypothetical protein Tco_1123508 [Tanacetum coccineum]|uniref:Protein kinase-like domain, concanavalin A-like lectin/glucanase domain protein n=1 Tax=Tanacetum coccineum TaxID=301880 RepID=A0ABQ5J6A8_9ASTR